MLYHVRQIRAWRTSAAQITGWKHCRGYFRWSQNPGNPRDWSNETNSNDAPGNITDSQLRESNESHWEIDDKFNWERKSFVHDDYHYWLSNIFFLSHWMRQRRLLFCYFELIVLWKQWCRQRSLSNNRTCTGLGGVGCSVGFIRQMNDPFFAGIPSLAQLWTVINILH